MQILPIVIFILWGYVYESQYPDVLSVMLSSIFFVHPQKCIVYSALNQKGKERTVGNGSKAVLLQTSVFHASVVCGFKYLMKCHATPGPWMSITRLSCITSFVKMRLDLCLKL